MYNYKTTRKAREPECSITAQCALFIEFYLQNISKKTKIADFFNAVYMKFYAHKIDMRRRSLYNIYERRWR